MPRKYSTMHVKAICTEKQCSLQEAKRLRTISALLDVVDEAETVAQLRIALSMFITIQTDIY